MTRILFILALFALPANALAAENMPSAPTKKPATEETAAADPVPENVEPASGKTAESADKNSSGSTEEALLVGNDGEAHDLPPYPAGAITSVGEMTVYSTQEEDTFLDIARHFGLGYVELRAANPGIDPWAPAPGTQLVIPGFHLMPRAKQEGIVVNLGEMRLYYFETPGAQPRGYAIGIGREGLATPTGETTVVRKAAGPSWFPTDRMRQEKPWLPKSVAPGPSNPLGTHALYLGWPTFLIHGSNKPWGIGRRVSSGCMRMYPEDVVAFFDMIPVGTKVAVVDQPVLTAWVNGDLYLEANPSRTQGTQIEVDEKMTEIPMSAELRASIERTAGDKANLIDWETAERVVRERRGYPVLIASTKAPKPPETRKEAAAEEKEPAEKVKKQKSADGDKPKKFERHPAQRYN